MCCPAEICTSKCPDDADRHHHVFGGGLIPTYLLINNLGMLNTIWAMLIPGMIGTFNMIIMRTAFQSVPISLEESAKIDGANDLIILFRIIIPLSMPVIAVMILWYAVGHWNSYFGALIYLRDRELFPPSSCSGKFS